jgi:hypothetical protein
MWDFLARTWSVFAIVPIFGVFWFFANRARQRDAAGYAEWWRLYRFRERRRYLYLAGQAGFERGLDETDDEYIERFRSWILS